MRDPAHLGRHQLLEPIRLGLDPDGHLADNLSCLRCGYNLRGLSPASLCPECGYPVKDSIRGNLLDHANPAWVARLAQGVRWITFGIVYTVAFGLVDANMLRGVLATWLSVLMGTGLLFVFLAGLWKLTAPEPLQSSVQVPFPLRGLARLAGAGGFLLVPLANIFGFRVIQLGGGASLAPGALGIQAAWLLILVYAGQLARRLPEDRLATRSRFVVRGLAGSYLLFDPMVAFLPLLKMSLPSLAPILTIAALAVALPAAILFLWSIKLIAFDYRAELTCAAEAAMLFAMREPAPESSPPPPDNPAGCQDADAQFPRR